MSRLLATALGLAAVTVPLLARAVTPQQDKPADPAAAKPAAAPADLKTKASYSIGLNIGKSFHDQGIELNTEELISGIRDGLKAAKPKMSEQECQQALDEFRTIIAAQQQAKMRERAAEANAKGAAFLAENAKKPNVRRTASGLQIETLQEGNGPSPKATDVVKVHYRGTLPDGKEFDSSYKRNEPATFPLNRVIAGWTEGLQLMKVGGKARLVLPPDLGYGEQGSPPDIPPNSVLVFEIELLGIGG
jgi:FKBP-type peptidyl-prolyl cis-trans isomerase